MAEIVKDAFGVPVREPAPGIDCTKRFITDLGVTFDPETGATKPDESNKVDLVALIQTYKDQCGMEAVRKLIATGQRLPEDFADDGSHSGDVSDPTMQDPQALANAALQSKEATGAILEALGLNESALKLSDDQLTSIVEKIIAEKFPGSYQHETTPEVKPDAE